MEVMVDGDFVVVFSSMLIQLYVEIRNVNEDSIQRAYLSVGITV